LEGLHISLNAHLAELFYLAEALADVTDIVPQVLTALAHTLLQFLEPSYQFRNFLLAFHVHHQPDLMLPMAHPLLFAPQALPLLHIVKQLG
jgi:hypothetical protein